MSDDTIPRTSRVQGLFSRSDLTPEENLAFIVDLVKALSAAPNAFEHGRVFGERVVSQIPTDHSLSITRRGLKPPKYRVSRCSKWPEGGPDPFTEIEKFPVYQGGIIGELAFANEPRILDDYTATPDDPLYDVLHDIRSYMVLPTYDNGEALNVNFLLCHEPNAFDPAVLPEFIYVSNLQGRTVHNLRIGEELKRANERIDRELRTVSELQHSLLPKQLPEIPGVQLATHYQTAEQAGGDYYDFFPFEDGTWGMLVADVCGHGAPAAVLMAITHALAHTVAEEFDEPAAMLGELNRKLHQLYTGESHLFVTAFLARYNPADRTMRYASAGHPAPLVRKADGAVTDLPVTNSFPLGLQPAEKYRTAEHRFEPDDSLLVYTDGVTEAASTDGAMFGEGRLQSTFAEASGPATDVVRAVREAVESFHGRTALDDDATVLLAHFTS